MVVILRVCESVNAVHDKRMFYKNKTECIMDCVSSLLASISKYNESPFGSPASLIIVEDQLSGETKSKINKKAEDLGVSRKWVKSKHGNVESFAACLKQAIKLGDDEFVLFIEDDYKVEENGIREVCGYVKMFGDHNVIINPSLDSNDFVDYLYGDDGKYERSVVLPGLSVYWKQVRHMTKTFGLYVSVLKENWRFMEEELSQGELTDVKWNKVSDCVPVFAPMTTMFRHMQAKFTLDWFESGRSSLRYWSSKTGTDRGDLEIVVSMSTMPYRIDNVPKVVDSIAAGTVRPDKMVVYICQDDFDEVPKSFRDIEKKHDFFEVRWSDANYGPATKLLPALRDFPEALIVNVDDDYVYQPCLIENLYNCWKSNRNSIITNGGHIIGIDQASGFLVNIGRDRVIGFDQICRSRRKGYDIMFLSGHGTMYPPHVFDGTDVFNNELRNRFWDTHDELWFWTNAVCAGVETVICGDYVNKAGPGHGWTINLLLESNPLWVRNNKKEKTMLEYSTRMIRSKNPDVLKYFQVCSPNELQPANSPSGSPSRGSRVPENDIFIPRGFELNPTLRKPPVYGRSFEEISRLMDQRG